jgi:hypothetical protein
VSKREDRLTRFLENCKGAIEASGVKALSLRSVLKAFGYKKRGGKNLDYIKGMLRENGLYITTSLKIYAELDEISLDDRVYIYPYPAGEKGKLFASEAKFQRAFVDKGVFKKLGLPEIVSEEYRPKGVTKILDLLCREPSGGYVVVELKNADGNHRAVEQVLEYIGAVRTEKPNSEVRGILITGTVDPGTLHAVYGLDREHLITWYQYWITREGEIRCEEVRRKDIEKYVRKHIGTH